MHVLRVLFALALIACSGERQAPLAPAGKSTAAPPPPTSLRVEALSDTSARVHWDGSLGAEDYDVNYRPAIGGRWTNKPHRGTRLYNTIGGLAPNTEYRWAVRAESKQGASDWVFGPNFTTEEIVELVSAPAEAVMDSFNIDLVFTAPFWAMGYTEADADTIRYAASRWERLLVDIPDWQLPPGFGVGQEWCGGGMVTQPTEVDDLLIFIGELRASHPASATSSGGLDRGDWRTHAFGLSVTGCVSLKPGLAGEELAMIFAHEIGHALGFGGTFYVEPPIGFKNSLAIGVLGNDPRFTGPHARGVYHEAQARSFYYPDVGIGDTPLGIGDAGHWRTPDLYETLMNPAGSWHEPFKITTLDVAAMADLGYPVRIDQADELRLHPPASAKLIAGHPDWCGYGILE